MPKNLYVPFRDFISAIVAGLDVKVEFYDDSSNKWTAIHEPVYSLTTPSKKKLWLQRISFCDYRDGNAKNYIEAKHKRLRELKENDKILGLAALATHVELDLVFLGTKTVGGLTGQIHGANGGSFIGYIDYLPHSARRETSSSPMASLECLKAWADEQILILTEERISDVEWCIATTNLCDLGLDPIDILRVMIIRNGRVEFCTVDAVLDIAIGTGFGILKSRYLDHIETYTNYLSLPLPQFKPVKNGAFLDLSFEAGVPKASRSFIGCLHRHATSRGHVLDFQLSKDASSSPLGPVDLLIVRAVPVVPS